MLYLPLPYVNILGTELPVLYKEPLLNWHHQDDDKRCSWFQDTLQEDQLATPPKKKKLHCENPRTQEWGQSTSLGHSNTDGPTGKVQGAVSLWPHYSSHRQGKCCPYRALLGLQFLQWENRAQGGHAALPVLQDTSQEAHSSLASQESLGETVVLNH